MLMLRMFSTSVPYPEIFKNNLNRLRFLLVLETERAAGERAAMVEKRRPAETHPEGFGPLKRPFAHNS